VLRFFILIVGGMFIGQHALVQDAGNQNAATFPPVKDDVLAMFQSV
jgi:hypothetical protein